MMAKRRRPKHEDILGFMEEFEGESDRAAAVLGAAYLDDHLRELIGSFLIDDSTRVDELLKGPLAPLGSFASRISASYCMGLMSKNEYNDLQIIREIRNRFAHELHGVSFSDAWVKNKCAELELAKAMKPLPGSPPGAREQFTAALSLLSYQLRMRILEQKQQRRVVPSEYW